MKLVGATDWFVRWPFILEGMLGGLACRDLLGGGGLRRVPTLCSGCAGQPAERAVRRPLHDHPAHRAARGRRRRRCLRQLPRRPPVPAGLIRPAARARRPGPGRSASGWHRVPRRYTQSPWPNDLTSPFSGAGWAGIRRRSARPNWASRRAGGGGQGRRHLPAPRVHPGQGAAPERRAPRRAASRSGVRRHHRRRAASTTRSPDAAATRWSASFTTGCSSCSARTRSA